MAISQETIDEVNRVANVYDVVSDYISLKKTGSVYVALCPFHSEKTPSFVVSPSKNIFKCFGCGIAGNAIKFVMEYEKVSFTEAVIKIAQKYNIPVKFENDEKDKIFKGLYLVAREILNFYKENLKNSSLAKDYIKKRGILPRIIEDFELGYSPTDIGLLKKFIEEKNISIEDLEKIGLITNTENGIKDKFAGRLIFPIKDVKGNVVAFGGRALEEGKQPKYLNSPDTVIYKKGNTLYGIYESLPYIKEKETVIIVEGYMDLISLHQIGIKNVVATLGTAFTQNQARLIKKYVKEAIIMFDSDSAGKKAAIEASKILLSEGITVKYAYYNDAKDPDELSKKGISRVKEVINQSKDIVLFLLEKLNETENLDEQTKLKKYRTTYNYILDILAHITDPTLKISYIKLISEQTKRDVSKVEADIETHRKTIEKQLQQIHQNTDEEDKMDLKTLPIKQKIILKYILDNPYVLQNGEIYDTILSLGSLNYYIEIVKSENKEKIEKLKESLSKDTVLHSLEKQGTLETNFRKIIEDLKSQYQKDIILLKLEAEPQLKLEEFIEEIKLFKGGDSRWLTFKKEMTSEL